MALPLGLGACAALLVAGLLAALPRLSPLIGLSAAVLGGIAIGWAGHRRRGDVTGPNGTDVWAEALPPGYRILHDVELPRGTVDHIVIAPTGVFVIVTPSQRGIVQVSPEGVSIDGRRVLRDPRRQAQLAAASVRELLQREIGPRFRVTPLVSFPRATVIGRGAVSDTPVLAWPALVAHLRRGPNGLPAPLRARIRRALLRGDARRTSHRFRLVGSNTGTGPS